MSYYTILTDVGRAKITNAHATGGSVVITELALGDGGGSYYEPAETQTALVNEVHRGTALLTVDAENPSWLIAELVVPAGTGGFTVREAAIFDDAGDMLAVGKYPETYKPTLDENSGKDLHIKMIIEVSNTSNITLNIDPSAIFATVEYVDNRDNELISRIFYAGGR
ncbi:phage tail protein [Limisalsivibrio acetivorans]|uniref:phage tail protein n=1 Tax=Limisalsivibrio acetivorans TaxID=1304888 RepID=UPI0003B3D9BB|nr:phage tail protein [Limisalsivibrio acetivorans]